MTDISNTADIIDVRNIIARYEELEGALFRDLDEDDKRERFDLSELLQELRGNGGGKQWRGDWYPVTLIRESYWEDYARDFAEGIYGGALADAQWPFNRIDWEKAASDLQIDYTSIEYDGVTYYYRLGA